MNIAFNFRKKEKHSFLSTKTLFPFLLNYFMFLASNILWQSIAKVDEHSSRYQGLNLCWKVCLLTKLLRIIKRGANRNLPSLGCARYRQSKDRVCVSVAVTGIIMTTSVTRSPHKDGSSTFSSLEKVNSYAIKFPF